MLMAAPHPLGVSCPELPALLVSLAGSMRVAEEMARGGRLEQLLALVVGPAEPAALAAQEAMPGAADPTPAAQAPRAASAGGPAAGNARLWQLMKTMAEHESEPLRARFAPALERIAHLLMVRQHISQSSGLHAGLQKCPTYTCFHMLPMTRSRPATLNLCAGRHPPPHCLCRGPGLPGLPRHPWPRLCTADVQHRDPHLPC